MKIITQKQFDKLKKEIYDEAYKAGHEVGYENGLHKGLTTEKSGVHLGRSGLYVFNDQISTNVISQ